MSEIKDVVENKLDEVIRIRRHIHENPELSFEEYDTTNLIYNTLKNTDIQLEKCSGGTGLVGVLTGNGKGPTLGIRADIDALPINEDTGLDFSSKISGRMHACGHDLHTSVLLGAALVLNELKDSFKGKIKFIFQPGEETMQGAKFMLDKGVLQNPQVDEIICLHTWPATDAGKIGIRHNTIMASSNRFEIKVFGDGGHAAHPHKSVDPIPVATQITDGLQQIVSRKLSPLDSAVVTVGQIHGGTADNIIATEVTISGTVRTLERRVSKEIHKSMKEISENIAKAYNASAEVIFEEGSPPVINDDNLVDLLEETVIEHLGEEAIDYLEEPSLGGEDFAFYLQEVKGMLFRLGTGNETEQSRKGLHNPQIIFDEKAIPTGMATMSAFAINYLNR